MQIRWRRRTERSRVEREQHAAPAPPGSVPSGSACGAPQASMYFAPDGQVRACCVNTSYDLGRIGERSIREIWEGARIAALRSALGRHDFSLGCQDCEHRIAAGDRAWSTAEQYDRYLHDEPGRYPKRMDFILSITCNLQCAMCDGELSSSIRIHREGRPPMPPAYGDEFFEELAEFLPHLERSVFLGGEPFVAREPQRVWDLMLEQGHRGEVQVITNGTQWNQKVERYLRELPMSITMSIDGFTAGTLESLRVGTVRDRVFENLGRYQDAVESHGGTASIHFCLMRQNWHEFGALCREADARGIHVIVMTVTGPAGFSLWDLPAAELRPILDSLEREDRQLAPQLDRNLGVWQAELDRVRRHLEALGSGRRPAWAGTPSPLPTTPTEAPVVLEATPRPPAPVAPPELAEPAEPADPFTELVAWAGRPPVRFTARHGVVEPFDPPAWAELLAVDEWVGAELTELAGVIGSRLGAPGDPRVTQGANGLVSSEIAFGGDDDGDAVVLRVVVAPGAEPGLLEVAVATDVPEGSLHRLGAP